MDITTLHTPGTWAVNQADISADEDTVFTISVETEEHNVATVSAFELIVNDDGSVSPGGPTLQMLEEARANARLIAAAPDLLKALKACLEKGKRWHPCDPVVEEALAAIAKATGAQYSIETTTSN